MLQLPWSVLGILSSHCVLVDSIESPSSRQDVPVQRIGEKNADRPTDWLMKATLSEMPAPSVMSQAMDLLPQESLPDTL